MAEEKHLLQQALELSPNPSFILGIDGKIILWNRSCEEFTGYKSSEMVYTDRHKRIPEENLEYLLKLFSPPRTLAREQVSV